MIASEVRPVSRAALRARERGARARRGAVAACASIAMLGPPAHAHPFGDRYAAQRMDVRIDRDGIDVGYIADVPLPLFPRSGDATVDPDAMLQELAAGLTITVDGATVPARVVHQGQRLDLVSMNARVMELVLRADAPLTGEHHVEVTNGNIPAIPCFHLADVTLAPSIRVDRSSLRLPALGGRMMDFSGKWSRSELRRRVQLHTIGLEGALPAAIDRIAADRRRPLAASDDVDAWWIGADTTATIAARLGLVGLIGAATAAQRHRLALVACAIIGLVGIDVAVEPWWRAAAGGAVLAGALLGGLAGAVVPRRARLALVVLVPVCTAALATFGRERPPVADAPPATVEEDAP